jgi:hypothetical protein
VIHVEPRNLRRLKVVTSDFHLPRTKVVFEWVYGLKPSDRYELQFEPVSDPEMPEELLAERRRKEEMSLSTLMPVRDRIATLPDFHRWLFTEHRAYSSLADGSRHSLDSTVLNTY